jgi:hypothetical protein
MGDAQDREVFGFGDSLLAAPLRLRRSCNVMAKTGGEAMMGRAVGGVEPLPSGPTAPASLDVHRVRGLGVFHLLRRPRYP